LGIFQLVMTAVNGLVMSHRRRVVMVGRTTTEERRLTKSIHSPSRLHQLLVSLHPMLLQRRSDGRDNRVCLKELILSLDGSLVDGSRI
jgi:hypothetical protein